jgi:hypothetical protein
VSTDICSECGAPISRGGSCRDDNFNTLLQLESQIPGGSGSLPYFYAVSSYVLQHPYSMNYNSEVLIELRAALGSILDGRATRDVCVIDRGATPPCAGDAQTVRRLNLPSRDPYYYTG